MVNHNNHMVNSIINNHKLLHIIPILIQDLQYIVDNNINKITKTKIINNLLLSNINHLQFKTINHLHMFINL